MADLKQLLKAADEYKLQYLKLFDEGNNVESRKVEGRYLDARRAVIFEMDSSIARQKSLPIREIKARVAKMKPPVRRETGIRNLDIELVTEEMYKYERLGGFALGNFIQIAGSRGSGKSSFMLKILTRLSLSEKVCWFDFEMGEARVVKKLEDFTHDENKLLYYNNSRTLDDVVDEIKYLNASGINHFVIDSTMKIIIKGADRYDKFSTISNELSALTSQLNINIYLINQISQTAERENHLAIKHGNDAEYDADFIFYILTKPLKDSGGMNVKDDLGMTVNDENSRILKCTKNRQDERLFTIDIPKWQIVGVKEEIYQEDNR